MTKTLPTTDTATVKGSSRSRLNNSVLGTRNLMTVAALAVVGSLIVVPLTYMTFAIGITTQRGMLIMCSCMGLWTIPYLLPAVIVRRPGACVLAGLIMGIICAFTSPQGRPRSSATCWAPSSSRRRWRSCSTASGPGGASPSAPSSLVSSTAA